LPRPYTTTIPSFRNPTLAFLPLSCYSSSTTMHEIDYQTLNNVIESWEKIRRLDDYELKAGLVLFRK
jgi:hypothetical protein